MGPEDPVPCGPGRRTRPGVGCPEGPEGVAAGSSLMTLEPIQACELAGPLGSDGSKVRPGT